MRVWAFPGQGSQRKGMGRELFARFPRETAVADRVLGYSIADLCLNDSAGLLRRTDHAQPALFVVNALTYLAHRETDPEPDYLAGHSLGELNALYAAGCFDFETGLRIVKRRGELMAAASGGQMVAVIGLPAARVAEVIAAHGAVEVDLANHNSPTQTVLAGPPGPLAEISAVLRAMPGVRCVGLNVSAAFHSRAMAPAAAEFAAFLAGLPIGPPRIPVLANVTGFPHLADTVAGTLARQVDSAVRWQSCMEFLMAQGVTELTELGPGRVLSGLWREAAAGAGSGTAPVPVGSGTAPAAVPTPGREQVPAPVSAREQRSVPAELPGERLGSADFRRDFGVRLAYLAGAMFRGVASVELVRRLGDHGLLGFFGSGGLSPAEIEKAILDLKEGPGPWGMNLLCPMDEPELEAATVELYLRHRVRFVEASAYTRITGPLVRLRFSGAHRSAEGPVAGCRIVAKVSRPEVAAAFFAPAPPALVADLVRRGELTAAEAEIAALLPMSEDVCVEADSGGHTDGGVALTLFPALARLRDEVAAAHRYPRRIRLGAAGGLGAPEAVAAMFLLGADFVVTGSVNQCTPEAGTSEAVKELLAGVDVQDTAYAPAGDMFELGARVQVVRKGTLFAARANKLYELYRTYESLEAIPPGVRTTLEEYFFRRPIAEVWQETQAYHRRTGGEAELERAARDPRHRMAMVFRWYFARSIALAAQGRASERANFQIQCGPAMGAFNRVVAGTPLADWRERNVEKVAELLMNGAARYLGDAQK
ncbi:MULTISPECIES: ACP S-malonyltransferase [Streptomyces]|uniref:ACP S-malonyltransferase n=1 Tax=Streptomyces TaxID=1883 RepID=UPI0004AB5F15|nr:MULTISPECIES: ACP S-malonyltransferase [Streptomyces]